MLIESIRLTRSCFEPHLVHNILLKADGEQGNFYLTFKKNEFYIGEKASSRWIGDDEAILVMRTVELLDMTKHYQQDTFGCDGETFILTISSDSTQKVFEWWCEPPEGWECLTRIVEILETLAT